MNAASLVATLIERKIFLGVAESCTGGLLAAAFTSVPGSSQTFLLGHVVYSNEAKQKFLGVSTKNLAEHGAVSMQVASEMAAGLLKQNPDLDIALSVTGIAGPSGGSAEKPVGLVYIGFARKGSVAYAKEFRFKGNREEIRTQSVDAALNLLAGEIG